MQYFAFRREMQYWGNVHKALKLDEKSQINIFCPIGQPHRVNYVPNDLVLAQFGT